jgi:hypothetical protein
MGKIEADVLPLNYSRPPVTPGVNGSVAHPIHMVDFPIL